MRRLLLFLLLSAAPAYAQIGPNFGSGTSTPSGNVSATTATTTGASSALTLAQHFSDVTFTVDDFGAPTNGTSDATTAIQAALNAASSAGGGRVMLGPYRYQISATGLTIPTHVVLMGDFVNPGGQYTGNCYATDNYTLLVNSSGTITLGWASGLWGVEVQNSNYVCPTTLRTGITAQAAMAGTAITMAGGDVWLQKLFILGFAQAVSSSGYARIHIDDIIGDNTAGIYLDNSHDTSHIDRVHWWPYITGGQSWSGTNYTITGVANNGSGLIRITTSVPNAFITGDVVGVNAVGGLLAANDSWTVTVIDSTHFDLQGSSFVGPTPTGTTASGSAEVSAVSSLAGIVLGQGITGTGIPGSTTIYAVNDVTNVITLSANATSSNTAETLTTSNPAYTSGGIAYATPSVRNGEGFHISNSEVVEMNGLSDEGHTTSMHLATAAGWTMVTNYAAEGGGYGRSGVGILVDGTSYANNITGVYLGSFGENVRINSTFGNNAATKISGASFSATWGYYTIGVMANSAIFDYDAFRGTSLYVADGATVYMGSNETQFLTYLPESALAASTTYNYGFTIAGTYANPSAPATLTGTYPNRGVYIGLDTFSNGGFALGSHDGTAHGGNTVGNGAVDLQLQRGANTQIASGANSFAANSQNTVSGQQAAVFNFGSTIAGNYSFGSGVRVNDHSRYAIFCHASGALAAPGDSQHCNEELSINSPAAAAPESAVRLTADNGAAGSANCINIPNVTAYNVSIRLHARDVTTSGTDYDWYLPTGLLTRDASAATTAWAAGTPVILTRGTTTGAAVSVTADTTNGCLNVSFTPPSASTDQWHAVASVDTVESQ